MKEVYVAYGLDGEVLYVGQGKLGRHRHCLNGTSHNRNLNKYFFSNGEDGSIRVEVLLRVETSEEALLKESGLILELKPKFNHTNTIGRTVKPSQKPSCVYKSLRCGFQVDFREVMKEFCFQINSNSEQAHFILKYHPEIEQYYEALGEDKIKALKYRKKDVEREYSVFKLKESRFFDVIKNIKVVSGDIITVKEAKELVDTAYKTLGIRTKVTGKTFEDYYIVEPKLVTIQGKRHRSYKVLSVKNVNLLY